MAKSDPVLRYVLSAGRTGTVFLTELINRQVPGVTAVHEPDVSRYQHVLANLRNQWGFGGAALKKWFERTREKRLQRAPGDYIEINPFLCPMSDLLPKSGHKLRVVHLVRDPATWAASIIAHKASAQFRNIIDHVPFAKPYPVPRPPNWASRNDYDRALWRWNWCNLKIDALRAQSDAFATVRFEDMFSKSEGLRADAFQLLFETLEVTGVIDTRANAVGAPVNASESTKVQADRVVARQVCGQLARTYGYDY